MKMKYAAFCSLLLGAAALLAPQSVIAVPPRPLGDSKVLTAIPALPGYPEGLAVHEGLVYVSGAPSRPLIAPDKLPLPKNAGSPGQS